MFKINIICIGRNKEKWTEDAITHYLTLLQKYANIKFDYVSNGKLSGRLSPDETMKLEADMLVKRYKSQHQIALSENGKKLDSVRFSQWLSRLMIKTGSCDMIIGGANGLDGGLLESCQETISLSPMTMSHQLVRPVLLEQLYRAFSILSGGKYHR